MPSHCPLFLYSAYFLTILSCLIRPPTDLPGGYTDVDQVQAVRRGKYGLGDRRTLDQAIEFSGVDTRHEKSLGNRCGNLEFVPFAQHTLGPDHIPLFDPVTELPLEEPDVGSVYYKQKIERDAPVSALVTTGLVGNRNKGAEKGLRYPAIAGTGLANAVFGTPDVKPLHDDLSRSTGGDERAHDAMSLLEKEYNNILRLEQRAQSALSNAVRNADFQEPSISLGVAVLSLVVLLYGICSLICGHRLHIGKDHRIASKYEPLVKAV